ncbi:MAG: pilus assembly protein [Thiohalomonadaceae bacterium]
MNKFPKKYPRQKGAALFVSLVLLLVLTLLGIAAMRNTTLEEKMAGNARDLNLAFNAAEAGLRGGEAEISASAVLPPFNGTVTGYFAADTNLWRTIDWATQAIEYSTPIAGVAAQPRYYLEEMPAVTTDASKEGGIPLEVNMYRVTAIGYGSTETAVVILQSTFRR